MSLAELALQLKQDFDDVCTDGKQAEKTRFWNIKQNGGAAMTYYCAFAGEGWTDDNYEPKYPIVSTNCTQMYALSGIVETKIEMDSSNASAFTQCFYSCPAKYIGTLDTRKAAGLTQIFNKSGAETIDLIILKNDGSQTFNNSFQDADDIIEIRFQGVIGKTISFGWSTKLSAESLVSIVEHLSTTTSGIAITISQTAVNNADWSKTNYASWDELKAIRENWTFAMAD